MGKRMLKYLFDTNILIYYFADRIPSESLVKVENILKTSFNTSIITNIEFLGLVRPYRNRLQESC